MKYSSNISEVVKKLQKKVWEKADSLTLVLAKDIVDTYQKRVIESGGKMKMEKVSEASYRVEFDSPDDNLQVEIWEYISKKLS